MPRPSRRTLAIAVIAAVLLVVGATAVILIAIAHQSIRTPVRQKDVSPEPAPERI